jgi:hypothetical protein
MKMQLSFHEFLRIIVLVFHLCYLHSGLSYATNFTLTDVSWLLDYLDSEDRITVATNYSLMNNSTYLIGEFSKNLEVRWSIRDDDWNSYNKMCYCNT